MYTEKKHNEKNARMLPRNLQIKWLSSAINEQRLDEWTKVDTKAHMTTFQIIKNKEVLKTFRQVKHITLGGLGIQIARDYSTTVEVRRWYSIAFKPWEDPPHCRFQYPANSLTIFFLKMKHTHKLSSSFWNIIINNNSIAALPSWIS